MAFVTIATMDATPLVVTGAKNRRALVHDFFLDGVDAGVGFLGRSPGANRGVDRNMPPLPTRSWARWSLRLTLNLVFSGVAAA